MAVRKAARTAKQKAALRKAQLVSARKRKGRGKAKKSKGGSSRRRRAALVAATGGLALAAAGVAGAYYVRKVAKGGPKSIGSTVVNSSSPELNRAMRKARRTGPPRSNSLKAVGYAFDTQNRWSIKKSNGRKGRSRPSSIDPGFILKPSKPFTGDPKFSIKPSKPFTGDPGFTINLARHRMADKANRKRGLDGYIPSKAKFDRRRTKAQRKKYPRI